MDKHISLLAFITLLIGVANCISICTKTPYPELCNSLVTTPHTTLDGQNSFNFLDVSLRTTLTEAQKAHKLISNTDLSQFDELAKSAWIDCVDLYEDTIHQLNQTIISKNNNDAQTWLSAAIANGQACQNGFIDFNLSSHLQFYFPFLSDFSKFLSNSLAINKAINMASSSSLYDTKNNKNRRLLAHHHGGDRYYYLPEWVSPADRKLLQSSGGSIKADMVVAQDGSGSYRTISEALAAAARLRAGSTRRFVIYVKKGVYRENVEVKKSIKNLMIIGDGIDATIVTGSKNVQDGSTTFRSATFAVAGGGFIARGITFENTAGPHKGQAVALRSDADYSVFHQCSFKGYQDTLYVHSQRQFYRECNIYGTVDFIFGDAVSIIQNSNILVRQPMPGQKNTITAQGRNDPSENTGIVIHNSRVTSAMGSSTSNYKSYLGRPWRQYSRTVFSKCEIDGFIDPAGWLPWNGDFALRTLYYGEYMNRGSGAGTRGRVTWPGFHVITSAAEAGKFSVGSFLTGDEWIPATGVPFDSGV